MIGHGRALKFNEIKVNDMVVDEDNDIWIIEKIENEHNVHAKLFKSFSGALSGDAIFCMVEGCSHYEPVYAYMK